MNLPEGAVREDILKELEQLIIDAKRYRWLKSNCSQCWDASIDAAMAATENSHLTGKSNEEE